MSRRTMVAGVALALLLSCPGWAQPTSRIAFMSKRDGNEEIYVMETDGSGQTNLTDGPWSDTMPCWSPDGKKIAFASDRKGGYDIHVMDADGGNVRRLTESPYEDTAPSWSPDGSTLLFCSDRGGMYSIYMVAAEGGEAYQLTDDLAHDISPAWSPDGRRIAFASDRRLAQLEIETSAGVLSGGSPPHVRDMGMTLNMSDIFVMDADGTDLINLGRDTGLNLSNWPAWSPDGTMILFYSSDRDVYSGMHGLFTVDVGSRHISLIFSGEVSSGIRDAMSPSWAPDGGRIVVGGLTSSNPGGRSSICTIGADGKGGVILTEPMDRPQGDYDPAWSPLLEGGTQVSPASWGQVKCSVR